MRADRWTLSFTSYFRFKIANNRRLTVEYTAVTKSFARVNWYQNLILPPKSSRYKKGWFRWEGTACTGTTCHCLAEAIAEDDSLVRRYRLSAVIGWLDARFLLLWRAADIVRRHGWRMTRPWLTSLRCAFPGRPRRPALATDWKQRDLWRSCAGKAFPV